MDMIDADMANAAERRRSCEERLRDLNNQWKRKIDREMRENAIKMEELKKSMTETCKKRVLQIHKQTVDKCNAFYKERLDTIKQQVSSKQRKAVEEILKLRTEVARLKTENAQLADAVAQAAAAATLGGMSRKKPRTGFTERNNDKLRL